MNCASNVQLTKREPSEILSLIGVRDWFVCQYFAFNKWQHFAGAPTLEEATETAKRMYGQKRASDYRIVHYVGVTLYDTNGEVRPERLCYDKAAATDTGLVVSRGNERTQASAYQSARMPCSKAQEARSQE